MKTFSHLRTSADSLEEGIRTQGQKISAAVDTNSTVMLVVGAVAVVALVVALRALAVSNR